MTQTFGFIGQKRMGKTHGAFLLVEEMLGTKAQVVVLDCVGNWWGLRQGRDGKPAGGFDIPIFGGPRCDVDIEPGGGALIADVVLDKRIPAVIDVSRFRKGALQTFVVMFAEQLFHRAQEELSPIHLVLEEAQRFLPERSVRQRGDERMLGALTDVVRLGGNYGIGTTMISQRPQSIAKEALNQVEALFVFKLNGAQERKAIAKWIVEKGIDETVQELPTLKRGECLVWSPEWLEHFGRHTLRPKRTFDSTATPTLRTKRVEIRRLRKGERDALRGALAETAEKAERDDPRALRRRVADLERQLGARAAPPPASVKTVQVPAVKPAELKRLERAAAAAQRASQQLLDAAHQVRSGLAAAAGAATRPPGTAPATVTVRASNAPRRTPANGPARLASGELKVLTLLAQAANGLGCTRQEVTVVTGYKKSSRDTYLHRLGSAGLVQRVGDRFVATAEGLAALGPDFERLPTGGRLREHWLRTLPSGESRILELVCSAYPKEVSRESISEATGYRKSSRDTYIRRLRSRHLVDTGRAAVRASSELFD